MDSERMANHVSDFFTRVELGKENVLDISRQIMDDGKEQKITFNMQNRDLQSEPVKPPQRAESPKRLHCFHDVDGMKKYLDEYGGKNTVVLIDVPSRTAFAVLDEKAKKGFEVVQLKPQLHPLFEPWAKIFHHDLDINQFRDFLAENRRSIIEPDGRELLFVMSHLRAAISTEIMSGRGLTSINGVMATTKIDGQDNKEEVQLPEIVKVRCPIFVSRAPVEFEVDIILTLEGPRINVKMTSAEAKMAEVDEFEQMAKLLAVGDRLVGFGAVDYGRWDYLEKGKQQYKMYEKMPTLPSDLVGKQKIYIDNLKINSDGSFTSQIDQH